MGEPNHAQLVDDLRVLLEVSRQLGASTELLPLLQAVERATLRVLDCERVSIFLYEPYADELYSKVATGVTEIRFSAKTGIAGEAVRTNSIINVPDAYADPRFNRAVDKQTGFRTRNLLTFCLTGYDGQVVGVLQALNKRDGDFTAADEDLAVTLSSLAGVAVQRQMLLDEYAEKQRLQRDLAVAREIQQSLLPDTAPQVEGYDLAGWNKPADETGGDCYDFMLLADGRWGLMLADATGHGIGPALMVSECRALLRAAIVSGDDLTTGVQRANRLLVDDVPSGRFVTTFFGVLDANLHQIQYLSAGHGPLLHFKATGERIELPASTLPMGILPELDATTPPPINLDPGDVLLLVTDGFFEWANPQDEQFGTRRIFDLVQAHRQASSAELIGLLHQAVLDFANGVPQADDLTAIVIRRL